MKRVVTTKDISLLLHEYTSHQDNPKISETLSDLLNETIGQRVDDIISSLKSTKKYQETENKWRKAWENIESTLGEEGRKIFFDFDEVNSHLHAIEYDAVYRTGFSDGVRFVLKAISGL